VQKTTPHYRVGIDLGTTHTAVAYCRVSDPAALIELFPLQQLVAPGQVLERALLPSVRYHPAAGELSADDISFSPSGDSAVLGEAARVLGAKTKGRLVTSAKSWLSHPSVDHTADILPWGSSDAVAKVSPIAASASYLQHIRGVWRHRFPDAPLENQDIVITVPASFDEAARSLTLAAAQQAGLPTVRLLEEPQAVCYDWLRRHAGQLQEALAKVRLLLVLDVGGGTTDLTLIKVEHGLGEPKLTRIGVGDHLMLGGDNIDLALARLAESRIAGQGQRLSAADLSQLLEQCRIAKERLLAEDAPEQVSVTLLGGGVGLISGTRSTVLSRDEVRQISLDGFFPLSGLIELPDKKRSGVVEFGLPYAADPAISKHIAAFLQQHHAAAKDALRDGSSVPDALLLNGGVFRSQPITERALALLAAWRGQPLVQLENHHPELAVAFGAVSYALARQDKKLKIGGGAARSYFLLIDTETSTQQGVCLLPQGSEENKEIILADRQFALRLGVAVRFHLASISGGDYHAGDVVDITDAFHSLPPLVLALGEGGNEAEITVRLSVMQTEMGILKIQCVAVKEASLRFDVEFQIRKKGVSIAQATDTYLPANRPLLHEKIRAVFGAKSKQIDPNAVKVLRADLEKALLIPCSEWPLPVLRELFTSLLDGGKYQRRSEHHERVWLSLVGFCLRPGFGYPLDEWRVAQIWKNYPQGIQYVNETRNWSEWWTLWRRLAGGLNSVAQEKLLADIAKYLNPSAARQAGVSKQSKARGYDDMVRLAAVLERLPVAKKIQLGTWLLKRLEKPAEPEQTWWAAGRVGARVPFYGSIHNGVPVETVSIWLEHVLTEDWKKKPTAGFAATLMARMSGDRTRDIDDSLRSRVLDKLKQSKTPQSWQDMVADMRELNAKDQQQVLGEALPPGLTLIKANAGEGGVD